MTLKNDYLKWKIGHINKPFVNDDVFFEERYSEGMIGYMRDIFKELMEIDARLSELEHRDEKEE